MLDSAKCHTNEAKRISAENQRTIENLEKQLLGGEKRFESLSPQNALLHREVEMLRRELQLEREARFKDLEVLKLELRLQLSEELRRLPPEKE